MYEMVMVDPVENCCVFLNALFSLLSPTYAHCSLISIIVHN
jgi:hypothetical protein